MSFFISLGIVVLAMLIQGFLQLNPSVFLIFYHNAIGKKSVKKADDYSLFYILGVEAFLTTLFLLINSTFFCMFKDAPEHSLDFLPWVLAGIFIALSLFTLFWYYRKSNGTELFISRKTSKKLFALAENTKSRSDAFILGTVVGLLELFLTFPICFVVSLASMQAGVPFRAVFIILYIFSATLPFFIQLFLFHTDHNLADIQKSRIRNKVFNRIIISLCYILLALATINMGLIL